MIFVFHAKGLEEFRKAEVVEFVSVKGGYEITYVVGEETFTVFYSSYAIGNGAGQSSHNGKLEFIYYQVNNPKKTFIDRYKVSIPPIIVSTLSLLGIIPLTIYEVKKGFKQ